MESRASRAPKNVGSSGPNSPSSQANTAATELAVAYGKLKRQYDIVRKELSDLTVAYDRLRTESAKEITKWKSRVLPIGDSGGNTTVVPNSQAAVKTDYVNDPRELRRRLVALEQALETERLEHKKAALNHRKELADIMKAGKGVGFGVLRPASALNGRRASSASAADRRTSVLTSRSSGNKSAPLKSTAPSLQNRERNLSADRARVREKERERERNLRRAQREQKEKDRDGKYSSSHYRKSSSARGDRSVSPLTADLRERAFRGAAGTRTRSVSPASSLGGKFDPTEWHRQQQEKALSRQRETRRTAWGGGGSGSGYRDHRYSSNYSQSSDGGSSRRSARSESTGSMGSRASSRGSTISASSRGSSRGPIDEQRRHRIKRSDGDRDGGSDRIIDIDRNKGIRRDNGKDRNRDRKMVAIGHSVVGQTERTADFLVVNSARVPLYGKGKGKGRDVDGLSSPIEVEGRGGIAVRRSEERYGYGGGDIDIDVGGVNANLAFARASPGRSFESQPVSATVSASANYSLSSQSPSRSLSAPLALPMPHQSHQSVASTLLHQRAVRDSLNNDISVDDLTPSRRRNSAIFQPEFSMPLPFPTSSSRENQSTFEHNAQMALSSSFDDFKGIRSSSEIRDSLGNFNANKNKNTEKDIMQSPGRLSKATTVTTALSPVRSPSKDVNMASHSHVIRTSQKLRSSGEMSSVPLASSIGSIGSFGGGAEETANDLSEIDKRIFALQSFLENARSGIFADQN